MKAVITICTAEKEFRQDQTAIMKRVESVLVAHDLSVALSFGRKKKSKDFDIKLRVI